MLERLVRRLLMIEPVFEEKGNILEAVCGLCGFKVPVMDNFFWQAKGLSSWFDAKGGSSAFGSRYFGSTLESKYFGENFFWTGDPLIKERTQVCDSCIDRMLAEGKVIPDSDYLD